MTESRRRAARRASTINPRGPVCGWLSYSAPRQQHTPACAWTGLDGCLKRKTREPRRPVVLAGTPPSPSRGHGGGKPHTLQRVRGDRRLARAGGALELTRAAIKKPRRPRRKTASGLYSSRTFFCRTTQRDVSLLSGAHLGRRVEPRVASGSRCC